MWESKEKEHCDFLRFWYPSNNVIFGRFGSKNISDFCFRVEELFFLETREKMTEYAVGTQKKAQIIDSREKDPN